MKTGVKEWYEKSYKGSGFKAQRRYPNEELLRFFGVHFFDNLLNISRKETKVLELGCGSCANLWMIAKEGFDAYGLDLSEESLVLGKKMLDNWNVKAELKQGSFLDLPYEDDSFDVIVDVFSINCVPHSEFSIAINELHRVLKKGGLFFSYTPGQRSSAFNDYLPANKIDEYTLSGIYRESSPFAGNHYPFHFWNKPDYEKTLTKEGLSVEYMESVVRSYSKGGESFEHIVVHARK